MIRPARWILLAGMALVTAGCVPDFLKRRPPLEQYILTLPRTDDGSTAAVASPVLTGTLAISPYVTRGVYDERSIVFRIDDHQLASYPSREWAIPLRDMLGTLTEQALAVAPLTAEPAVFDPRSVRSNDYYWRGTVREFEEVNRGRNVLAAVHLEVEIIRSRNDSLIWRGSERIERAVPPPTKSMTRVVETLSGVTADVLFRLITRARTDLVVPTSAAATAPPPE